MSKEWRLLASSGSFDGISASIKRYFGGEEKKIEGENVISEKRGVLEGYRVTLKRGRYRFEETI
jgi:hypothetical protein